MKLTAFFILATCLHVNATDGYGQKVTLSEREVHIEKIFTEIKKQTGFNFLYTSNILANTHRVTVKVTNALVTEVLDIVLAGQGLEYRVKGEDNLIIIKTKPQTKAIAEVGLPQGGPIDVTGRVTDGEGRALAGANVKVRGTSVGVITDNNGNFILKNVSENAVLEISFVGHEMKTFVARKTGFFNISLDQKLSLLDETVVIAYGGTTSRRFTTGNVATIKAIDIEKQPVQNPLLALQGRVPGVEITQLTGLSGGAIKTRIQGINSFASGLEPLIVIDGVPYPSQFVGNNPITSIESIIRGGSPLNFINPNDIESIDILKDADATAIFGSRAANGAILITSKKGKAGQARLTVRGQQGWGRVTRKVDMMNTRQYLDMRYEAFRNDGIVISNPTVSANDLKVWDTTRHTDWQKELIGGTAKYTNLHASLSGGTTTLQYLVGASYNRQTSVFPGNFDDKAGTLHFSINGASRNQKLTIQLTGSYTYDQNHLPGIDLTKRAVLMEPVAPALYNEDGTLNWALDAAGTNTWSNPLAYMQNSDFINTTKKLVSNAQIRYRIVHGLEFNSSIGYTTIQSELYWPFRLEAAPPQYRDISARSASFGNRNMSSWIIEPQLKYTGRIGKGKLEGFVATSIQKSSYSYLSMNASGFLSDLLMKTLQAATSVSVGQSISGITRFNALFGRLAYNWEGKYLLNLTARRDGSNKFGKENRFHNFGSIGLGWIFSQEKWISQHIPIISFGKLRASFGTTGNDQIPDFSYLSIYNINNPPILYQGSIGLNAANIPNPYLQWEETRKWQGGIDLGFINDRLIVGVTHARNRSSNQLLGYDIPTITGFTGISKNLPATIQNTSWEITLNTVNIRSKSFRWTSNANLTIPQNKLISYPGIEETSAASKSSGFGIGHPIGQIALVKFVGVNPANGGYVVLDKNNNPITSSPMEVDKNIFISTFSQYYGGVTNSFSYNNFQFEFLFQFVRTKGTKDMYFDNGNYAPGAFSVGSSNQPITVLDRWKKPGDNATFARFTTSNFSSLVKVSDAWYDYEASYIRLKNVSLSWRLPEGWLKKAKLQDSRLFVNAQNLVTITSYTGLDPETMTINTQPPLRMITIGGQIDFYDMPNESDLFQTKL